MSVLLTLDVYTYAIHQEIVLWVRNDTTVRNGHNVIEINISRYLIKSSRSPLYFRYQIMCLSCQYVWLILWMIWNEASLRKCIRLMFFPFFDISNLEFMFNPRLWSVDNVFRKLISLFINVSHTIYQYEIWSTQTSAVLIRNKKF